MKVIKNERDNYSIILRATIRKILLKNDDSRSCVIIIESDNDTVGIIASKLYFTDLINKMTLKLDFDGVEFIINKRNNHIRLFKHDRSSVWSLIDISRSRDITVYDNTEIGDGKAYIRSVIADKIRELYNVMFSDPNFFIFEGV